MVNSEKKSVISTYNVGAKVDAYTHTYVYTHALSDNRKTNNQNPDYTNSPVLRISTHRRRAFVKNIKIKNPPSS